ncbi:glycosyltransferase family 4 protein [Roseomonas sp. CECT 9278]|uniref:glycosyltransferase family 4 protein n=1 Tax=Roseomonas sp. CECT 9278 TaxID=2845823 RepID=UPI001E41FF21|nr:glycosyltransferase family 4 protein [Roseomonas sp. CECT 9278]CAH0295352.1 D-inositol-3-phosphate glycosyltransferase [Roseomonas sp. CECT 9278]
MRIALYHPWIYLKSGLERTLFEYRARSRHEVTLYTSRFAPADTYPELRDSGVVELPRVSVKRTYLGAISGAARIATTRIDPARFDALVVSCDGLGDLLTLRNRDKPILALVFTPLRAVFDEVYRERALGRLGPFRPLGLVAEAAFKALDRACWRNYDTVVAISDTVRGRILRGGLRPQGDVGLAYPGIAAARITGGAKPEPYFLIAGRIMWTKNIRLGLEAFALAKRDLPGWRLVVAGMVDDKSRAIAEELMARGREIGDVEFHTDNTDAQMQALQDRCTALLFTAFNEDWGLTPLEAMAAGRPVVAVDRGGPRESVQDGVTGFLTPDDPAAFAERMLQLARDPALAARMGAAGTERARLFTWDAFVDKLDDAVERMVEDRRRRKEGTTNR